MIVKRHFSPISMWPFVRFELLLATAASLAAWALVDRGGWTAWVLPPSLVTVPGTALAILLAVRANTAYQRWWEGAGLWAQLVGSSRTVVRVATTISNAKTGVDPDARLAFQADIARRQVAFLATLRDQLRGTASADEHLDETDRAAVAGADNRALQLLSLQSARIYRAYDEGLLTGLDNFQIETALASASTQQALAERLAALPVPRPYDVWSRYLVHLYTLVFPFALIGAIPTHRWIVIPATAIVAFAFRMVERIGAVVEAPFGNTVQDVPLTAWTVQLARDLTDLIGATGERPPRPKPVSGYLW